ncbi:MAG: hypothetical protein RLZZ221_210, partial [Verrucomicrobiota bacterium]
MASFPTTPGAREHTYDAIVIGSGISGGWAAKELCDRGRVILEVLDVAPALEDQGAEAA